MSERRTIAKRLSVGAAVAMLAVFGGVAYAQQGDSQQTPGAQQERGPGGDCPWGEQRGEGQPQQTEV